MKDLDLSTLIYHRERIYLTHRVISRNAINWKRAVVPVVLQAHHSGKSPTVSVYYKERSRPEQAGVDRSMLSLGSSLFQNMPENMPEIDTPPSHLPEPPVPQVSASCAQMMVKRIGQALQGLARELLPMMVGKLTRTQRAWYRITWP